MLSVGELNLIVAADSLAKLVSDEQKLPLAVTL